MLICTFGYLDSLESFTKAWVAIVFLTRRPCLPLALVLLVLLHCVVIVVGVEIGAVASIRRMRISVRRPYIERGPRAGGGAHLFGLVLLFGFSALKFVLVLMLMFVLL